MFVRVLAGAALPAGLGACGLSASACHVQQHLNRSLHRVVELLERLRLPACQKYVYLPS
jgi:hypothetical protein